MWIRRCHPRRAPGNARLPLDGLPVRAQSFDMRTDGNAADLRRPGLALGLTRYAGALLMVAGATLAGLPIAAQWGTDPVVLLYLAPVLAAAVWFGLWPALAAAVAST